MTDKQEIEPLYGIIEFPISLFCSKEVLGKEFDIKIGSQEGKLCLPGLPEWKENEPDPLHINLIGPTPAENWKRGEDKIFWGSPTAYPSGNSTVEKVLLKFDIAKSDDLEKVSNKILEGFSDWLDLFNIYIELTSKQNITIDITIRREIDRIDLFQFNNEGKTKRHQTFNEPIVIKMSGKDTSLKYEHLKTTCELTSEGKQPSLEYLVMIEAYRAQYRKDYRKSIIEAAIAAEITLTNRINEELETINISERLKKKLLNKFRMLGGRFELLRLLDIDLPEKDYHINLIEPRNDVIHKAWFPNEKIALQVIETVEELLNLFSPNLFDSEPEA